MYRHIIFRNSENEYLLYNGKVIKHLVIKQTLGHYPIGRQVNIKQTSFRFSHNKTYKTKEDVFLDIPELII